ncbi:MAG TPA: class I SAM-dependent methyltransferase [Opitutaceae bacterium]|nr:class I SAM-dependent methyltransferase [Opitutaceae bacterium]
MPVPSQRSAPPRSGFDRLARIYRGLEFLAFGGDLERTRFCLLDRLRDSQRVLILGEGDGRCLARLATLAPNARLHCVDSSPAMLAAAEARLPAAARDRVTFVCADVAEVVLPAGHFDAVTTFFFLDCFTDVQVEAIVGRIARALTPDAMWLFSDFVLPPRGWRRLRARLYVSGLYLYFRWQTGLQARALPDSEAAIERAGFQRRDVREFQHGLLRASMYHRIDDRGRRTPPSFAVPM